MKKHLAGSCVYVHLYGCNGGPPLGYDSTTLPQKKIRWYCKRVPHIQRRKTVNAIQPHQHTVSARSLCVHQSARAPHIDHRFAADGTISEPRGKIQLYVSSRTSTVVNLHIKKLKCLLVFKPQFSLFFYTHVCDSPLRVGLGNAVMKNFEARPTRPSLVGVESSLPCCCAHLWMPPLPLNFILKNQVAV